ncbi:MAG: transporter [Ectobacillus sp.]
MYYYPYWHDESRQTFPSWTSPSSMQFYPFPPGHGGGYPSYPSYPPGQGGYPSYPPYPPGQGPDQGPPQGPPPAYVPDRPPVATYAVDPGGIRRCLYRYTYIWLRNGRSFWFYPIFVGRTSVAGYRWRRNQYRWVYTGIDLNNIDYFECS